MLQIKRALSRLPCSIYADVRNPDDVIERPNLDDTYTMLPAFTIAIAALQVLLSKAYKDSNTSFFILHSLVNAAITVLVWPELCVTLGAPIYSLRRPYSLLPSFIQMVRTVLCPHLFTL